MTRRALRPLKRAYAYISHAPRRSPLQTNRGANCVCIGSLGCHSGMDFSGFPWRAVAFSTSFNAGNDRITAFLEGQNVQNGTDCHFLVPRKTRKSPRIAVNLYTRAACSDLFSRPSSAFYSRKFENKRTAGRPESGAICGWVGILTIYGGGGGKPRKSPQDAF